MKYSELESLDKYLQKEFGIPSVLDFVGRRFVFSFTREPQKVGAYTENIAIFGTISGAILETNSDVTDPEDSLARLDLEINAPRFRGEIPFKISAWMYKEDEHRDRLKWTLYVRNEKNPDLDDNSDAWDGHFHLLS